VTRRICALALAAVATALVVAGCGGGGGSSSGSSGGAYGGGGGSSSSEESSSQTGAYAPPAKGSEEEPASAGEAANVSLAPVGDLGKVLVESKGLTLYDFHKDEGGMSSCYGACAEAWPPLLTTGAPQPGNGASASMLGTVERKDGTMQVTYAGHPLYTFVEDEKPGESNGNDVKAFGGQWYALKGSGEEAGG
jgi:predicted lipoprotein with Yx(FWY)xxD motif